MLSKAFSKLASFTSRWAGNPWTFIAAALAILIWAASGPFFGYSDVWQLTVNTGTTIITFLMVFLIQNSQNRDTRALQIKLDELLRATTAASNSLIDLEDLSEMEIEALHQRYRKLAVHAKKLGVEIDWDQDNQGRPSGRLYVASIRKRHPAAAQRKSAKSRQHAV